MTTADDAPRPPIDPETFYTAEQRRLQQAFGTRPLADAVAGAIVHDTITEKDQPFIESRDFFFLSTVSADGWPTVSYKGGAPGLVRVIDDKTLAFPSYDGNGMFLSMGNIAAAARIGMLFIDMETPHRLRVQATAEVSAEDPLLQTWPGAQLVIRARVEQIFVNCPRYIHRHARVAASPYVPDECGRAPLPGWKRIDVLQPVLPAADQGRAETEGGLIDIEGYERLVIEGKA